MSDGDLLRRVAGGVLIAVRLQPGAGADRIDGVDTAADGTQHLRARVTAVAEKGRANAALARLVARSAGVAKSSCEVVAGHKQRTKRLLVRGEPAQLEERIGTWLAALPIGTAERRR